MKKLLCCVLALGILLLLCGCNNSKKKEEEERAKIYAMNLNSASVSMLAGAEAAEYIINTTSSVWYDAIYQKINSKTLKYVFIDGKYVDFNEAIDNLYRDESFQNLISTMTNTKEHTDELMSLLTAPPEQYQNCYNTLTELYKEYSSLISYAKSPSGTYNEFTSKTKETDENFGKIYDLLQTQLPDIDEST